MARYPALSLLGFHPQGGWVRPHQPDGGARPALGALQQVPLRAVLGARIRTRNASVFAH